jgi:Tfp pilus assembly protein PilF
MSAEQRLYSLLDMLKKEPVDVFLNYALALEYLKKDDREHAEGQLKKVLALDPAYVAAYYQLGKLYEAQNNPGEALRYYHEGRTRAFAQNDRRSAGEFDEAIFLLED